jgi:hypothetical protein
VVLGFAFDVQSLGFAPSIKRLKNLRMRICVLFPSYLAEHRRNFAMKRAVSERPKGASLASAQNTEERKGPLEERRGIRVAFSLVRFVMPCGCFWPVKRNKHVAFRQETKQPTN